MAPPTRTLTGDPPGTAVARFLVCLKHGGLAGAAAIAAQHCRTTPQLETLFNDPKFALTFRAAVPAGSTGVSHWADDLAPYGVAQEAFLLLQSASITGRLSGSFRQVPFRVKIPREPGAGAGGAWRGEGLPTPILRTTLDTLSQERYESDVAMVVTSEVFRFGRTAERTLRDLVTAGLARWLDKQLLDPTVTVSSARPGALTSGATAVISTGSTAAQILADLASLIAAIESPGDSLRWVMRPLTYFTICARLAGVGYPTTPGFLLGIPVVAGSTSPQQITLIDASAIAYSADEAVGLSVHTEGDVEMLDSALVQSGIAGTGTTMVSMYQSGLVAIKAGVTIAWQPAFVAAGSPSRPQGVSYMAVTY